METEVKERLVGAIILVLLAVLVLPALLSGPRQPKPVEPAAPAPTRSVDLDLGGARPDAVVEVTALDEAAPVAPPAAVREAPTGLPGGSEPAADIEPPPVADAAPPPAAEPVRQAAAPAGSGWAVQVAALSSRDAAMKSVADLQRRGYTAFILEYRTGGRVLYRVRVGPEAARERAAALAARMQAEGIRGNVVSHP